MAVYYKFKSAKDYDSIAIDGHFITVGYLKEKIFESKQLGRGKDFDILVTNAQTNEEYLDEATMVPKNTSVLIRRVPGMPRMNIVTQPDEPKEDYKPKDPEPVKSTYPGVDSSAMKYPNDTEWDEFGEDLYAIPEVLPIQSSNPFQDAPPPPPPPPSKDDEDNKIKALIETPTLDWQNQGPDGVGQGRGFGRGMGRRMMNGRGFGRLGSDWKTPSPGYICHRCKVPGHLIQHCPTNGDSNYDVKRAKPPTGIPKSMLMATPDGSYALSNGIAAVLRPNEAAFEKEIEGLPSTRVVGDLPPEFSCPLCNIVMKDAVLTSKCCFMSFCDKCIRDYIISNSMCISGATNILADDLLPNKTLRDTINRILESYTSSAENAGSTYQAQDMESARFALPKVSSPTFSAVSKGEPMIPQNEKIPKIESLSEGNADSAPHQTSDMGKTVSIADMSETTHDSMVVKEPASQGGALLAGEEVQQRVASVEAGLKKKKKKVRPPSNGVEMQLMGSQDFAADNCMVPHVPNNPYWNGMLMGPGMDGYMGPYDGLMPFMGYAPGPMDMPFGNMMHHDPFGAHSYMLPPVPPQRDLAGFGMGFNAGPPIMSREEFEARKADLRRKRDLEKRGERECIKDRDFARGSTSNGEMKSKYISGPNQPPSTTHNHRHHRRSPEKSLTDQFSGQESPRPLKRKSSPDNNRHHKHQSELSETQCRPSKSSSSSADDRNLYRHHKHRSESSTSVKPSSEKQPPASKFSSATVKDRNHKSSASGDRSPKSSASDDRYKKSSASDDRNQKSSAADDRNHESSVFSRISFPEGEESSKKRKVSSSSNETVRTGSAPSTKDRDRNHKISVADEYQSSDDEDRHFKRRLSRYEPSKERDHGGYSKHGSWVTIKMGEICGC